MKITITQQETVQKYLVKERQIQQGSLVKTRLHRHLLS